MQTIRDVARHLKMSSGEVLEKAKALGLPVEDVDSEVTPDAQRDLKRVRSLSIDQVKTFIRHAPLKEKKVIVTVPDLPGDHTKEQAVKANEAGANSLTLERDLLRLSEMVNSISGRITSVEEMLIENLAALEQSPNQIVLAEKELRQGISSLRKRVELIEQSTRRLLSTDDRNVFQSTIGDFQRAVNAIHREVSECTSSLHNSQQSINQLQLQLKGLQSRLDTSEADIRQANEEAKRIEVAIRESQGLPNAAVLPSISRLKLALEAKNIFFQDSILNDCIDVLSRGKPLLLVGPAGTGKTELARHLPFAFWDRDGNSNYITQVEAHEHWTPFDLLGYRWPVGDKIVFRLGYFSESIIQCVENEGKHWLFIDEFNRADVDKAFAGLLGTIGVLHEGASLNIPTMSEPIQIPKSFRLICAMNDSDERHLFPISTSISSRFEVVRIDPPNAELERTALLTQCAAEIERVRAVLAHRGLEPTQIDEEIDVFLFVLSDFRRVGDKTGAKELILGVRDSVSITQRACSKIAQLDLDLRKAFGESLLVAVARGLELLPSEAIRMLLECASIKSYFQLFTNGLHHELTRRVHSSSL